MKTVLALLLLATPTMADHCRIVRKQAVAVDQVVAVPFVAPLGVVIPGSPIYSYRDTAQAYGQAVHPQVQSADAKLFSEFLEWKKGREANQVTAAVVPQTLLQQNCVKCHTSNADAKAHLDMSVEMTAEQKLAASRALLKGTMPKNKTIDDKTRGNLLGELLGVEEAK